MEANYGKTCSTGSKLAGNTFLKDCAVVADLLYNH